jgi:hypothetical protein
MALYYLVDGGTFKFKRSARIWSSRLKITTSVVLVTSSTYLRALAGARAFTTTNEADAVRQQLTVSALARAALFTNQLPAFAAAPSVYRQRAYFQTFALATANARKYVLLVTNTEDVVIFNLEDQIRADLLNLNVSSPTK